MNKQELENLIQKHDALYWEKNHPEISDVEYDKLVEQLREIDPDNQLVNKVNGIKTNGEKVNHNTPMLSLEKVYSDEELFAWVQKRARNNGEKFLIEPKFDGLSAQLDYGVLATRGDGSVGQNITDKLCLINIETNKKIDVKKDYFRGELVIRNSSFEHDFSSIKTKTGNPFKNSRNAVAGIIGTDDVDFYVKQGVLISLVDYDLISFEVTASDFSEKWKEYFDKIVELDFPMDGIVVKIADSEYSKSLGATEHHPRGQIAFKFTNQSAKTKLVDIEWGMGKENITAVGIFEPISLGGVVITKAILPMTKSTINNLPCIIDEEIAIGDIFTIQRAGDVIPNVVSIERGENRKIVKLEKCPFCGADVEVLKSSVRCKNEDCFEPKLNKLYFSVSTLGMKAIGKAIIEKIMRKTGVVDLYGFMNLNESDLENISGFGKAIPQIILSEINKAKTNKPELVLTSLNVPSLGKTASKLLLSKFTIEQILRDLNYNNVISIKGIGEVKAIEIVQGIAKNREYIKKTLDLFNFDAMVMNTLKAKQTVCFTGKMAYKRSDMENIARQKGYEPVDSVTSQLSLLVCEDPNSGSSKLEKAKKMGIKIVSADDFMR